MQSWLQNKRKFKNSDDNFSGFSEWQKIAYHLYDKTICIRSGQCTLLVWYSNVLTSTLILLSQSSMVSIEYKTSSHWKIQVHFDKCKCEILLSLMLMTKFPWTSPWLRLHQKSAWNDIGLFKTAKLRKRTILTKMNVRPIIRKTCNTEF